MTKKVIIFFIFFILICNSIFATEIDTSEEFDFNLIEVSSSPSLIPNTLSKHILILDRKTQTVLYEKNGFEKTAMASTTKILTALIIIENCNLNDLVKISSKAANTGGSTLGIKANTTLSVETLLYGLLLRSGNDCAVALAEHVSGSVSNFSELMNQKASTIGVSNSHFVTPHGLDSENHYTTAYDLAIITNYALQNEIFSKIVNTKQISLPIYNSPRTLNNTNELLDVVPGVYGVKTGFTGNAGRCLVTACKRDDLDIIIIVIGADSKKIRGEDTLNLINYTFSNYENYNISSIIQNKFNELNLSFHVKNSSQNIHFNLGKSSNTTFPLEKNNHSLKYSIYIPTSYSAPIKKNSILGKFSVFYKNQKISEFNIVADNNIYIRSFIENYKYIILKKKII